MLNEHTDYDGEVDVPAAAIQVIDPAVASKLPSGTSVKTITAHGASFWTRTARLETEDSNKATKDYFLKTLFGNRGRGMMLWEYTAMAAMRAAVPDLVPQPIAWGTYETIPDVHFFLCDFHNMTDELPDIDTFPAKMAELHRNGTSPNGKFGFGVTTYHGQTALDHGWADTWEEFFTTRTMKLLELEQEVQGPSEDIEALTEPFFTKVIPRLLRPLETGGRSIKPCLVHGDLWHGNATMDSNTKKPLVFDAACFYAHNEYDLGVWRQSWNNIDRSYIVRYHEHFRISQPEEDQDDRNLLYATRVNILDSILLKKIKAIEISMRDLVNKFP